MKQSLVSWITVYEQGLPDETKGEEGSQNVLQGMAVAPELRQQWHILVLLVVSQDVQDREFSCY